MVASTDIKFYVHSNNNAPQLQNAYGSMIGVLDACLVNGISLGQVSSLTAIGTTVTAVFSTAHNLLQYQVLKLAGANQSEYNGEHRILTVPNATSVTFQLANVPSVTTASGVITASLPPLGWERPFSSNHPISGWKAAYRSKNVLLASRPFLRVADEPDPAYNTNYAKFAKVGIVEDMLDIDTMIGVQAPFDASAPNKNWIGTGSGTSAINGWARWYYARPYDFTSNNADSDVPDNRQREYIVVGNTDYFYILPTSGFGGYAVCYGFGEFQSYLLADTANNFLSATFLNNPASSSAMKSIYTPLTGSATTQLVILQRPYTMAPDPAYAKNFSLGINNGVITSGGVDYIATSLVDNVSPFAPIFIADNSLRGQMNGIYWLFQKNPFMPYSPIEHDGSVYIAVKVMGNTSGQVVLKIGDL